MLLRSWPVWSCSYLPYPFRMHDSDRAPDPYRREYGPGFPKAHPLIR